MISPYANRFASWQGPYSVEEQLPERPGVHRRRDPAVGLGRVLPHQEVGHRHAAGEPAGRLDGDVRVGPGHQVRTGDHRDGERGVQRTAALLDRLTRLDPLLEVDPRLGVARGDPAELPLRRQGPGVRTAQPHLAGHVQADEPQARAALADGLGRLRVAPEVVLARHRRAVRLPEDHPAHDDALADRAGAVRRARYDGQVAAAEHLEQLTRQPGRGRDVAVAADRRDQLDTDLAM